MAETIEIDDQVMQLLKDNAQPFIDTPNSVLRRLLGLEQASGEPPSSGSMSRRSSSRATSRTAVDKPASTRKRAPAGSILPEEEYYLPILQALSEFDGKASSQEVVDRVGEILDVQLTPLDRQETSGGRIRWRNRAQFARLKLIDRGYMASDSPRGIWAITVEGRTYLESHLEEDR